MSQCLNCNSEFPSDNAGPCPVCGHASATLDLSGVGILDVATAEVGYGPQKSWLEQWGVVERSYEKLKGIYDSLTDNQIATSTVKEFFIHCWHLKDWLVEDREISVESADIGVLLRTEPDLKVCNAMANTSKHHTLSPGKVSARVVSVVTQPKGQVTIEITSTSGAEKRDALELANSCMSIWKKFLKQHGPPT
ncbi:hypothetical protein [Arthrobacter sp. OAP107]|uniref:hypothetical protein n=1 Tax=Arthrobacter sp. OAP107 TaxID=3156445 RepID=UPI0033988271